MFAYLQVYNSRKIVQKAESFHCGNIGHIKLHRRTKMIKHQKKGKRIHSMSSEVEIIIMRKFREEENKKYNC